MDQTSIDATKHFLTQFLPKYLNIDLELPKEYHYEYKSKILLDWIIDWTDIKYSEIDLDMSKVTFELTQLNDKGLLKFDFPALKHWEITANQHVNTWILPSTSQVELIFKDFDIDFEVELVLDEKGYIDPVVYKCDIDFGESYFYHENTILKIMMHQLVQLSLVIIENSSYFMGKYMFTEMLGPVLDVYLKHYTHEFLVFNYIPG